MKNKSCPFFLFSIVGGSCSGRCFEENIDREAGCYCDDKCSRFDNCCIDFVDICVNASEYLAQSKKA